MQAELKMEEKTTGIDVETSELDALLEEVLEKEKDHLERNLIHEWEEEDFGRLWTMPFLKLTKRE